jgi:TolB protein
MDFITNQDCNNIHAGLGISAPAREPQHMHMKILTRWLAAFALTFLPLTVSAQGLEIDIVSSNASATPITIVPMSYQGTATAPATDVYVVVTADLARSGQFRTLPENRMFERPVQGSEIEYSTWKALKQDYIVVGRILDSGTGGYRVEYELFDIARQQRLLGQAMTVPNGDALRDLAHQMADAIYEKITGVRGAFWTRIAYVTQTGIGETARWGLVVADADGYNPHTVVSSDEPILSPSWSPDGRSIAYASYRNRQSGIFIVDITRDSTQAAPVASFRGINGSPAFSPDGRKLAMSLSRSGNPDIYVMDLDSRAVTQMTTQLGIDTEPVWSADGNWIYFTSDRGGNPQIYRRPAEGGVASRVTFQGNYNASPSLSFDGQKLAVLQGSGNSFRIALMDNSLGSPRWSTLSPGSQDESPSFAPNASMVLYSARERGRSVVYVVAANGSVRARLNVATEAREPAWGPYRSPR